MEDDGAADTWQFAQGRRPQPPSNECVSRSKHPLDAGVHLFFFDELTPLDLVQSNLHLFLEPLVIRKHPVDGFLYQFVRSPSRLG
jgi:hypothetical protein